MDVILEIQHQLNYTHKLVRLKSGNKWLGIDNQLTEHIDEAALFHPDKAHKRRVNALLSDKIDFELIRFQNQ